MIIKQMPTTAIQLPFELTHNNIPLQVPEQYCCNVDFPDQNRKVHFHMVITYLEICEEYKIIQFDRDKSDYTNPEDPNKYFNWFLDKLYPMVMMVDSAGGIIEVCNREEILNRIESLFKKLYSPYISEALQVELKRHYENFHNLETILGVTKEPFFQLVLFPLYTYYAMPIVYFENSFENEGETHQYSFSAKLDENLNEFGHITIGLTGLYNRDSNFHLDATHTFDPTTHRLQSIKGEMMQTNRESVLFEFGRLVKDS
jgi:hypothetical protein